MKTTFNLTTSRCDLDRFSDRNALLSLMEGFDGVELMCFEEDERQIIPPERVIGLHMGYFPFWVDCWRGDEAALCREFGSLQRAEQYYGGLGREPILRAFRRDLENARRWGAEYAVLHTSHAAIDETFTLRYRRSHEEVIDALCEVVNELFAEEDGSLLLLLENLWQPGLTFTRPDITRRLWEGIRYPNKGFMLDTGHLLHTDLTLRTQEEGLAYIHRMLDREGDMVSHIRGIHLNQSLTGEYCRKTAEDPPAMESDYDRRCGQMFLHAFAVDQHLPFTCPGVRELVERVKPDYLTFEFITETPEQHRDFLMQQRKALGMVSSN